VQLKIFALGSCISLALFSPVAVGLCHVALPNSKTDIEKSISIPGYFADTAVPAMKAQLLSKGANPSQIFAKIAGGAKTRVEIGDYFGIGQKNTIAVKAQLIKAGIRLVAEETGGEISRTAYVKYGDKMLSLHHPVKGAWEI
jgi:chemotaxis protein CheD